VTSCSSPSRWWLFPGICPDRIPFCDEPPLRGLFSRHPPVRKVASILFPSEGLIAELNTMNFTAYSIMCCDRDFSVPNGRHLYRDQIRYARDSVPN